jgi:cobyrinic acid a,c-diamide synthase
MQGVLLVMKKSSGLLISAPSSGTGKTTVTLGLLRALRDRGFKVQPFKSGPDYIDPAFHRFAAGRPSFNLDTWAMDSGSLQSIEQKALGSDLIIAEGSMGLYDGVLKKGVTGFGSSAETAKFFGWPVILVIDVSGQAQSAAATALGYLHYNSKVSLAGVILNRVASQRHERYVRRGMEVAGINVLGALPRRGDLVLPERHLGLVQAVEHEDLDKAIVDYANFVEDHIDIPKLVELAKSSHLSEYESEFMQPPAQRIALAQDEAFSFTYPHLIEGWHNAGAEIFPFSPLENQVPDQSADLVWLPGGYPELHAAKIAAADRFFDGLRAHAKTKAIHGECGGYMVLGKCLIDKDGVSHRMADLLGLVTSYEKRKFNLGYRKALPKAPFLNFDRSDCLRGHEFHYSSILDQPDQPLLEITDADGNVLTETGSRRGNVSGTFFHLISKGNK